MSGETGMCVFQCHVSGALKHLDHGFILVRLDNASELLFFSVDGHFHDLIVRCPGNAFEDGKRAV